MMRLRWWTIGVVLASAPIPAAAQPEFRRDAQVIYKDGFYIIGKVKEQPGRTIWDPTSGLSIPLLSGDFYIDDYVRFIRFSPSQVLRVEQMERQDDARAYQVLRHYFPTIQKPFKGTWSVQQFSSWTDKGTRTATVFDSKGTMELAQKIHLLSPKFVWAYSMEYLWDPRYYPQELGRDVIRNMLLQACKDDSKLKKFSEANKYLWIARFQQAAGWFDEAEKELVSIINAFPESRKPAEEQLEKIKKERAEIASEAIEHAGKIGQHLTTQERLDEFDRAGMDKLVSAKQRLAMLDLRAKYDKAKSDVALARAYVKALPSFTASPKTWTRRSEFIIDEINLDTIGRLETFLLFAQQFEMNRKNGEKQPQSAEQVLAIAVTGWLQGNRVAEPDIKLADKLVRARAFLLGYLGTEDDRQRITMRNSFKKDNDLPFDVLLRMIPMIPPPAPQDAKDLHAKVQTIEINVPNSNGGSYLLQLPPDYHHLRSHPVLIALHAARDKPDEKLKRLSEEAARHGFILVAPQWVGKGGKARFSPGDVRIHQLVDETLRDLRRRFNVDSDRVFLFGFEEGASIAYDVGLGHPDQYAGVVPMCGTLPIFTRKYYWANAQNLPFYVIEGNLNFANVLTMRDLFNKEWTREPFASLYIEYRGRASEWFSEEIPRAFFWMSRKKRATPFKDLGRLEREFRTTRAIDNRFYWLSTESIAAPKLCNHGEVKWPGTFVAATCHAKYTIGNKLVKGEAKIWNHLSITVSGLDQVTLTIPAGMMDMTKPLLVFLNGRQRGDMRDIEVSLDTLLEELYQSGDRQRLYVAKIEFKV